MAGYIPESLKTRRMRFHSWLIAAIVPFLMFLRVCRLGENELMRLPSVVPNRASEALGESVAFIELSGYCDSRALVVSASAKPSH